MRSLLSGSLEAVRSLDPVPRAAIFVVAGLFGLSIAIRVANLFPKDTLAASSPLVAARAGPGGTLNCKQAVWPSYLHAELVAPARMLSTETKPVSLKVTIDPAFVAACAKAKPPARIWLSGSAALSSPAFDVAPPAEVGIKSAAALQWDWLVRPKAAGSHALLLTLRGADGLQLEVNRLLPGSTSNLVTTANAATLRVEVSTELGISPWLESVIKVVGAVLGGILAFVSFIYGSGAVLKWWQGRNAPTPPSASP